MKVNNGKVFKTEKQKKKNRKKLLKSSKFDKDSYKTFLKPSTSEYPIEDTTNGFIISKTEEINDTSTLIDESFDTLTEESKSFTYSSIIEEFINEDVDNDNSSIISVNSQQNKLISLNLSNSSLESDDNFETTDNSDESLHDEDIKDTTQYYYTNDGIVVVLENNDTIYFYGLMLLSVLHGEIEVLGYKLTKNCKDVKLYSLRGSSLLYLKNTTAFNVPVTHYLLDLNIMKKLKFSENCAIILCKKLDDSSILFIEKHVAQQILPSNDNTHLPRVVLQPKGNWNLFKLNENWNKVINDINNTSKVMICGGKGVGKSTFIRYAINKLLMKFKQVRIIDLDPGQPEFTVPGCISVVKIDEPIFGGNYTHLRKTERSILSNINIAYEPERYIDSVKCLIESVTLDEIPTLINFMGYTHGIGINILSAVIVQVQPNQILQIYSHSIKKNYKFKLTKDVILKNSELFVSAPENLNYKLQQIESMCDENDGWTAEPRQLREMNILAYISKMSLSNSIFDTNYCIYRISLSDIKIADLKGEIIHPAAVNACLVALCSLEKESLNIFQCHGWGVVRGIDLESKTLVLLTPEKQSTVEKVFYLILNSATLPPSIFMTPDEVIGQMPYVVEGTLVDLGQIPKRSRISVKK